MIDEALVLEPPVVDRPHHALQLRPGSMPAAISAPTMAPADVPAIRWNA